MGQKAERTEILSLPSSVEEKLYHSEAGGDDDGVEEGLGDVRVEVRHGAGEGRDVVRQAVVRVLQPRVQVGHAVKRLVQFEKGKKPTLILF